MTGIEEWLRASFADQVRWPRIGDDMAGRAIRGARVIRRRRVAMATVACAVAVMGVACVRPVPGPPFGPAGSPSVPGAAEFGTVPATPADPAPSLYGVALDVLETGNFLRSTEGRRYDLGGGRIRFLDRVPAGWLFGRDLDDGAFLLRPDGTTLTLRARVRQAGGEQPWRPVVSADGRHIAWVDGTTAYAAELTTDGEQALLSSPVPADSFAETWIGSRVVLGQTYETGCCGYNHAQYDVWDPAKGTFVPHWTRQLSPIYGPVPDGVAAFAAQQIAPPAVWACLVRLDGVRDLTATAKACVDGLLSGSLNSLLAPDGRHLIERTGAILSVFDLATVLDTGRAVTTCPSGRPLAWEGSTAALIEDESGRQLVRCDAATGTVSTVDKLVGSAEPGPHVVRRYGV